MVNGGRFRSRGFRVIERHIRIGLSQLRYRSGTLRCNQSARRFLCAFENLRRREYERMRPIEMK